MKTIKNAIMYASCVMTLDEYFKHYFVLDKYALEHKTGNFIEVISAKLTVNLKDRGYRCQHPNNPDFARLVKAIVHQEVEPPPQQQGQNEQQTINQGAKS